MLRAGAVSRVLLIGLSIQMTACVDQFNPRPDQKKFESERVTASIGTPKLKEDGSLPYDLAAGPQAADAVEVVRDANQLYSQLCSSCHGAAGGGDGPASAAMNPKPRNLKDKTWQAAVDDARIYQVIEKGGASLGLSAMMAPWGSMVNDKEIQGLVKVVRAFGK